MVLFFHKRDYPCPNILPAHIISILSMNIFQSVPFGRQVMWLLPLIQETFNEFTTENRES